MMDTTTPNYRFVVTADRTYLPLLERELTELLGRAATTKHQWVNSREA